MTSKTWPWYMAHGILWHLKGYPSASCPPCFGELRKRPLPHDLLLEVGEGLLDLASRHLLGGAWVVLRRGGSKVWLLGRFGVLLAIK